MIHSPTTGTDWSLGVLGKRPIAEWGQNNLLLFASHVSSAATEQNEEEEIVRLFTGFLEGNKCEISALG